MVIELNYESIVAAISTIFAIYKAICWLMDRYEIGQKRKENKLMRLGSVNLMREIIRTAHREALTQGYMDEDELEHVEKVYEVYHALGGNSVADR